MENKKSFDKKKIIRIAVIVVVVVIIALLVWFLYFYPRNVFRNNERLLQEAGERYYEINRTLLPKEEGRVISVSLDTLVKQEYLEGLYEAYGNKLCDLNNSNVKAVNKNGDLEYYTYLKCGSFESDVDHDGPVITLKGSKNMTVNRGSEFTDPGIKSVVDNVDGTIDIKDVRVKGDVDTSKVGSYKITYEISDSLDNTTTVTRTVKVEESLASTVKENTTDGYYVGDASNNYIYFNNMLFRIVRVNDDNSITIVSDDALANVNFGSDKRYNDSELSKWLNDYFYNLLENENKKLLVKTNWCDDVLTADNVATKTTCDRTSDKYYVGILSMQDYNKTLVDGISYLDMSNLLWYSNFGEDGNPWAMSTLFAYPDRVITSNSKNLLNVRPAVTLSSDTKVYNGDGTNTNPYQIINKESARKQSPVNKAEIGEYISYSGYLWRIAGFKDDMAEIIMEGVITSNGEEISYRYNNGNKAKVYNPNQNGNLGYQIVNETIRYVDTDLLANVEIEVPIYNKRITYLGEKSIKKYKSRLSIPSTFEIFSAKAKDSSTIGSWCIDSSKADNTKAVINPIGTMSYDFADDYSRSGIKGRAYLNSDVLITEGDGTKYRPYIIK